MRAELDRLAAAAWPATEQVEVDGWLLRSAVTASGAPVTKRANSALLLGDATSADVETVTSFYRDRGLPPLVQVSDPALESALDVLGWQRLAPTTVMTGELPSGEAAPVAATPTAAWLQQMYGQPDEREVVQRMLAAVATPAGYAAVELDGRPVALARGVVHQGWLGVFSMRVAPTHRRRGLATRLLAERAAWAAGHAATGVYLQVEDDNAPARALYGSAGLTDCYGYHYRRLP